MTGHFCIAPLLLRADTKDVCRYILRVARSIRPSKLLEPERKSYQLCQMPTLSSKDVSVILYRRAFERHSPPAVCNSSDSLSSHLTLVLIEALLSEINGVALAACQYQRPSLSPSLRNIEETDDKDCREKGW